MKATISLFLCILLFSSCSQRRAALYYFNKIVAFDSRFAKLRASYDQKIETAIDGRILSGNYSRPDELRQECVNKMNGELARLKKRGKFQGDGDLQEAAINFFAAIRNFYTDEKKEIIGLRSRVLPASPDDQKRMEELEAQIVTKSQTILNEFVVVQQSFAKKYGFPLIFPDK